MSGHIIVKIAPLLPIAAGALATPAVAGAVTGGAVTGGAVAGGAVAGGAVTAGTGGALAAGAAGAAEATTGAVAGGSIASAAKKLLNPRQQTKGQFAAQMAQNQANAQTNAKQAEHEAQANRSSENAEKAKQEANIQKEKSQESFLLRDLRLLKYLMELKNMRDTLNILKGQLQLPGQLASTLQDDIMALDPNHEIVETGEGTIVNNLNPFMEDVVSRLHDLHTEKEEEDEPAPMFTPATLFY